MFPRIVLIGLAVYVLAAAEDRLTGGTFVPEAQEFVVSIQYDGIYRCSGFSVSSKHIITTAQCVKELNHRLIDVYANRVKGDGMVYFAVIGCSIHELYEPSTLDYDVAVLTAVAPTGELLEPTGGIIKVAINPNAILTAIGWAEHNLQDMTLKGFNVNYIKPELCMEFYNITSTMVCTTAQSLGDTCPGDEGSVLIQGEAVVGIVSRTIGCQDLKPTMYTYLTEKDICSFLDTATAGSAKCKDFARP